MLPDLTELNGNHRVMWHRVTLRAANGHILDVADYCPACWTTVGTAPQHTAATWIDVKIFAPRGGLTCSHCAEEIGDTKLPI